MRIPKCNNIDCRNNNRRAGFEFCSKCKAEHFRKFQTKKRIFNHGLYDKITNDQLFDLIAKHKLNFKPVSQQYFFRHISFPYLKILLELPPEQIIDSFLRDDTKYAAFGAIFNKQYIIWLSFDSMNYMFVPNGFTFTKRRIKNDQS